ncbi:MAG TPA: hypothetical protein DEV87_06025 [Clostridiales bacterium]|nr:hypothetical protein [Clostridiales bacterium]
MLQPKNRLVFGVVKGAVKGVLKAIYKVLSVFNLHFTLFLAVLGLILYLTGTFEKGGALLICYVLLLILSVIFALFSTIKKVFKIGKKKGGGVTIVNTDSETENENVGVPHEEKKTYSGESREECEPRYYRVKQDPRCIMAEYPDRYVLYRKTENGLKRIRTDYKR